MPVKSIWGNIRSTNIYKHLPLPTHVWRVQQEKVILADYNSAALEFSGPNLNQLIGLDVKAMYSDMPEVPEFMNHCRIHKQTVVQDLEMPLRTTGKLKILKCTWVWIDPNIILSIFQDLTEITTSKLRLEKLVVERTEELQTANTQLKKGQELFDQGPVIVITWKPTENWPIGYISENVKEILGYTTAEMKSSHMFFNSLIHPDDVNRVNQEAIQHLERGHNSFEQYYRLKTKSGEYLWLYDATTVERDEQDKPLLLRGYLLDQTDLKNAELHLEQERQRLSDIIEGTNVGSWSWNIQTGETFFNERWAATIGYSLAELEPGSTKTWVKHTHPEDLKKSLSILRKHLHKELKYYEYEGRLKHKDGSWVWVLVRGKVSKWAEDGTPLLMSGTHQDISKRKKAEIALQNSHVTLEQKIKKRTAELAKSNMLMHQEIKSRKISEQSLLASEITLEQERASLQETNIALKVMMREAEQERKTFEENIAANLMGLVDPYLKKLKNSGLDIRQSNYIDIIETHLQNIVSPFARTSVAMDLKFTLTEIQIANLIRNGRSSKQIAMSLSLSPLTIEKHRSNIRKKLGITNQKVNLKTLLQSRENPLTSKEA